MIADQDQEIREALAEPVEMLADSGFTASVLLRMGRRRRLVRTGVRLLLLITILTLAAVAVPELARAYGSLGAAMDLPTLVAGLTLLFFCAIFAPAIERTR